MHIRPLRQPAGSVQAVPASGTAAEPVTTLSVPGRAAVPTGPQRAAMTAMLTGLWVAISPWFLTLQTSPGGNAAVNNLIIGLAITGLCLLMLTGTRSLGSLVTATQLGGVWLIISPFILDVKFPITASMYWNNVWSGVSSSWPPSPSSAGHVWPADPPSPGGPVPSAGPSGCSRPHAAPARRSRRAKLAVPRPRRPCRKVTGCIS